MARSYGGYTTNLPLPDLRDGKAWIAYEYDGQPLPPEHGGPGPAAGPAPVLLEVRQVGHRPGPDAAGQARLLGAARLPRLRGPMARAAVPGRLTWRGRDRPGDQRRDRDRPHPRARRPRLARAPGRPARHRQADRRGRVHRAALVLDRERVRAPARLELTVQRVDDGEVSSYLAGVAQPGDQFELRGPIGGWFAWRARRPAPAAAAGGRLGRRPADVDDPHPRGGREHRSPLRLIYSARTPADVIYADELSQRARVSPVTAVTFLYTRLSRWRRTPASVTKESEVSPEAGGARHGGLLAGLRGHAGAAAAAPGPRYAPGYACR